MAIYHLSGSVISRSQGRSAVACAAYRSGERLVDERYEKTHDYTQKQDVEFSEILLPEHAHEWMSNREKLWNAVEATEKRKDAQLAREIQISLPRELTIEQNIELAREFIKSEFVEKGMVADWALHVDKTPEGELQPHVHVMLTMREIKQDGFGQKVREWNSKENLMLWREQWAEIANHHLALNGHDISIDHRSNLERGIDLEPQHKIGTSIARDKMARLEDHQRIARENGKKIFANPSIALNALTRLQSTFTHEDLAKLINRHTVDAEQFSQVFEKVKGCEQIVALGLDTKGRERFTSHEMLNVEKRMLEHSNNMSQKLTHKVSDISYQKGLAGHSLSEEQRCAYSHLLSEGDLKCVVGYAGTGKSYLLGAAREAWEAQGYNVKGATLAGIAAENLEASSGIESRTLASRMYYWDKGEELLTNKDILVVDEAGMLGSRQMERLLREAQKHHAKVVLIGDPQQLQAIEAGAAFRAISERTGYVELTEVRRQQHEWQRKATKEFAQGKASDALKRYRESSHVHEFETQAMAKKSLVELWNDVRINDSDKTQIMLSYTRKDAQDLNIMAREMRRELGELGKDHILHTEKGEKAFARADRVYFLQNDRKLGVKNGSLGTIEKIDNQQLTVRIDRENTTGQDLKQVVTVDLSQYNHIDYGYAATIHKGQGVTVDRSYLLASKYMDNHATYVGMSRHRESADLFWSKEEFANEQALSTSLSRERAKDISLDHGQLREEFSANRGIEVSEKLVKEVHPNLYADINKEQNIKAKDIYEELGINRQDFKEFNDFSFEAMHAQQAKKETDELAKFKQEFERENPGLAKSLSQELRTEPEKRAQMLEKEFNSLAKRIEKNPQDYSAKKEMAKLAEGAFKDKSAMEKIKECAPELGNKIQSLAKAREREKELSRERDLDIER